MAADTKLKIRSENGEIHITWRDALYIENFIRQTGFWLGLSTVAFPLIISISNGNGDALFFAVVNIFTLCPLVAVSFAGIAALKKFSYSDNSLIISKTAITHKSKRFSLANISRVEYGTRGQWDQSDHDKNHRYQIRLWFNDARYHVVSENDWVSAVNHEIQTEISNAIQTVRRNTAKRAQPHFQTAKPNEFGIPDY